MILNVKYDFIPDIVLPDVQEVPIKYVEKRLDNFTPDLWLDVNAGQALTGKPKHGIRTTFLTDPHVLMNFYKKFLPEYTYIFNPQKNYRTGLPNEYLVPYAADKEWHSPIDGVEKLYDFTLIGNVYSQRVILFNKLRERGFRTFFGLGKAKDDAQLIYSQSIAGINWSSMVDITARVFEISALGITPIMNYVPGIEEYLTAGIDALIFYDLKGAIEYCEEFKNRHRLAEFQQMGKKAREKMINGKHFWDDRVQQMLEIIK